LLVVGRLDEFVHQLGGQRVADPVPCLRGRGAEPDQQVRFSGAGITDQAERVPGLDPGAGRELVDRRGVHRGVGLEIELLDALVAGEAGVVDAASGAALVPVVTLGHHQFGEEPEVGQLLALGRGRDLFEPVADRGQPQHASAGVDRGDRGLFGDTTSGGRLSGRRWAHELAFPSRSS